MNRIKFCLYLATLLLPGLTINTAPIKAICIDMEALFETSDMRASGYVGKINSLKYLKQVGNLPCQQDLFKQLAPVPAQSTHKITNNGFDMPAVFCDWLLNVQPATTLIAAVNKYLASSKLSAVEKTVLGNVAHMMMTPSELLDTQQTITATHKIIDELVANKYKVYLVGNWSDTVALKGAFSKIFTKIDGLYCSGNIHELKPYPEFYQIVLEKINLTADQVVWVEKEISFIAKAKQNGLQVAQFNPKKPKDLSTALKQLNVKVK